MKPTSLFDEIYSKGTNERGIYMQDENIVALYWERNEAAIEETKNKYEHYLFMIAHNILMDFEDFLTKKKRFVDQLDKSDKILHWRKK